MYFFDKGCGWHELAKDYATKEEFNGKLVKGVSACFKRDGYYNGILVIGKSAEYLYLSKIFFFKLFSKNLLIPRNNISISKTSWFNLFRVKVTIKNHPDIYFRITPFAAKRLGIEV